jgi:hypothetical protein
VRCGTHMFQFCTDLVVERDPLIAQGRTLLVPCRPKNDPSPCSHVTRPNEATRLLS